MPRTMDLEKKRSHPRACGPLGFVCALALPMFVCGLMAGSAQAQSRMYKCVDAKGKTYYTQTPPAECLGRDTEVLNTKSGSVLKRIEGQLSPEQQAKRE